MKSTIVLGVFIAVLALATQSAARFQPVESMRWMEKVDTGVYELAQKGQTEFIVFLTEQADLNGAYALGTKLAKGKYVYERLTEVARREQDPVVEALKAQRASYRPYWIANMIWVRGGLRVVQAMAERPDVAHIYANPKVRFEEPTYEADLGGLGGVTTVEWNIAQVNAPQVWAAGFTGQGAVVGGQDTGYEWSHPALKGHYRGWDGSTANHNYSWHDAIHDNPSNPCGSNSPQPCDDDGHGTHTMGTIVGDDPSHSNQIGMAPGATWIGCRNMDEGFGTPITYSECYQWFIAPTDLNNENPDPAKAPDVINNSWICPPDEGCTDSGVLQAVVDAVRAAGIVTVHSAGNAGPDCGTIADPAAIYETSFTVGSTMQNDRISEFSSRGPVTVDGSGRLKPDISAPGENIRSSVPGGYDIFDGTSMAGPHVAGLVALLISANPALKGQVDLLEASITGTAKPIRVAEACGGISGGTIPNNAAGWGRIDALAAYLGVKADYQISLPTVIFDP